MPPPTVIPQLTESEARGATADIYADIRTTLGVPIVNLVWRHLATIDEALPACWRVARPLYASGLCAAAAARLWAAMPMPAIDEISSDVLRAADTGAADITDISRILDAYHRANPLNLLALRAVELSLVEQQSVAARALPNPPTDVLTIDAELPPMPGSASISQTTAKLIAVLESFGAEPDTDFPPSLYRHLAYWPGFLAVARDRLQPLHESRALYAAIGNLKQIADREAAELVTYVVGSGAAPPTDSREIANALSRFTRQALPRLIVIIGLLRGALIVRPPG